MVLDLGLTPMEQDEIDALYSQSKTIACSVQVMDLEHRYIQNISDSVLDGQVTINWEGDDATRSLEVLLFDPEFDLGFDVADFNQGVWFFDRMIQVRIEIYAPNADRWIEYPLFTGPVRGFKRSQSLVTLKCVGKDIFARQSWPSYKIPKGTNKIDAIRRVLANAGETKFRFEETTTQTTPNDVVISRDMQMSPWGWCRWLARSMGMALFYNGLGQAVLRKVQPSAVDWVLSDGDGGMVLTHPDVEGDYDRIANVVRAVSSTDPNIFGDAQVADTSSISPTKLKRGGQPLYFGYEYQSDTVKTKAEALAAAREVLIDRQAAAYNIQFDALPLYAAEEYDTALVSVEGSKALTPLLKMSFGLKPSAEMPVGYNRMVAPSLARIRRL